MEHCRLCPALSKFTLRIIFHDALLHAIIVGKTINFASWAIMFTL